MHSQRDFGGAQTFAGAMMILSNTLCRSCTLRMPIMVADDCDRRRKGQSAAAFVMPRSAAPADRRDHLVDPGFLLIDGRTGADQRALLGTIPDRVRGESRDQRVGAGRVGVGAGGATGDGPGGRTGMVRARATAAGKR